MLSVLIKLMFQHWLYILQYKAGVLNGLLLAIEEKKDENAYLHDTNCLEKELRLNVLGIFKC